MARTKTTKTTETDSVVETKATQPLTDIDEIEVVSLVPNVSYQDNRTNDMYEWDEVGHVEIMTFGTIKNMWRSHKGYFKNLILEPKDERIINQFGLTKTYNNYKMLMDENSYIRENIDNICELISNTPNGLKSSLCNKIKNLIIEGKVVDIVVIRALEKVFDIDLILFIE